MIAPPRRRAVADSTLLRRGALLASLLIALLPAPSLSEQLPVRTYTIADGLAHDQVDKIMQDSHGFLWFCTIDGLSRFDGYRFTNYGARDGLPLSRVNDMLESRRDGIYWIATNGGGVSRFDPRSDARLVAEARARQSPGVVAARAESANFTSYRVGDEPQTNIVESIYEDAAGNVWAGTQGGLFRLAPGGGAFERVSLGIPSRPDRAVEVASMVEDAEGSLWIGTNRGIVRRLPGGRNLHHPVRMSQGTDYVWSLLADGEGRLWIGHQTGLLVCLPAPAATLSADTAAAAPPSWRVAAGPNARADDGRLLVPAAPGEARFYTTADGLAHNNVQALRQFADGRVWIGTRGGLSVFDGARFRNYSAAHGLSARVSTLAEDRDGNVWVGTQTSGAAKIVRGGFVSYAEGEGLGNADVFSMFAGPAEELLVVSAKWTLNWFDGEKFSHARFNLPRRMVDSSSGRWHVLLDHKREWWVATGEGLYRFPAVARLADLATAKPSAVYTTRDGLADDNISRLFEDSRGDIWISSYNPPVTLTRWERATGTFRRYAEADGIPPFNWANVFNEDSSGALWIGLHNGGLLRRRNDRFERVEAAGVTSDALEGLGQGLYFDRWGRLWVATSRGGLRFAEPTADEARASAFEQAALLSSGNLRCFAEDSTGRFYIGTARGVDRVDPETGRVKHFTTADGLSKSEVVAAFRDASGALWFGTREGLSRLAPAADTQPPPPPVLIGGLRVGGVPVPVAELGEEAVSGLVLGPGSGQVQIDFFGLSFSAGEELRYQYTFEGAGGARGWSEPTDQRTVTASLAPGDYRFVVRALNSAGSPSARPAVVSFRILPPVWQRWWFISLAVLAVAGAVYAAARYRVARAVDLERVRTRIATDLHDDIGASLSQIAILSEVVTQRVGHIGGTGPLVGGGVNSGDAAGRASVTQPLAMIANTSREMVDSMSDIVWAINPQKDHLHDLKQRMRLFASDMLSARDIRFRFEAHGADLRLGADLRREVYLIFKECVNNLAKHSGGTEADIELRSEGDWLTFRLSDNGRGFDPAQAADGGQSRGGHGLGGMRRRAEALGGTFAIESAPGKGTIVSLRVPVRAARRLRLRR